MEELAIKLPAFNKVMVTLRKTKYLGYFDMLIPLSADHSGRAA
jgi:hypothetical protein